MKIRLIALSASFLFIGIAVAHAQVANISQSTITRISQAQDAISARDQDMYNRLGISQRFGVAFRPHQSVCNDSGPAVAHCDARVISDYNSAAPDRISSNRRHGGGGGGGTPPPPPPPPTSAYGPQQFLGAYKLSGQAPTNSIIAIVDAYDNPNIQNDLTAYSNSFGIPSLPACSGSIQSSSVPCFQKINQNGSTSSYPSSNTGWALEIALDVEAAHAVCQNCSILLVEANSSSYSDLMTAVDRATASGAKVVSNSWGSGEFNGETSYDSHFNHPGVAFTVSAGDSGYGTEYPASSQYVTAVGGTSLFLNSNNTYNTELTWSGTGSGCSLYEAKPSWQKDTGCARRTVTDVSADADPNTGAAVYDSLGYGGHTGWFQVGGTSLAAPLVAAVYAQSGNIPSGVQESSLPYSAPSNLNDVLSGSNGNCSIAYLCNAQAGYDGPTGLGSPMGTGAF